MPRKTYNAIEKLKAIERELSFRRRVYPRFIDQGRLSREMAAEQIAIFEAIRSDYIAAEAEERLI